MDQQRFHDLGSSPMGTRPCHPTEREKEYLQKCHVLMGYVSFFWEWLSLSYLYLCLFCVNICIWIIIIVSIIIIIIIIIIIMVVFGQTVWSVWVDIQTNLFSQAAAWEFFDVKNLYRKILHSWGKLVSEPHILCRHSPKKIVIPHAQ